MKPFKRTLTDGREVDVGRNHGIRKICACSRHKHAKCPHAWYFNFSWQGRSYRLSLDRYSGTHVDTRIDAEALADQLRARDNDYRLKLVCDFALPGTSPALKFGDKRAVDIATGDIDSYRHDRREDRARSGDVTRTSVRQ